MALGLRLGSGIKELRIHLCPISQNSVGVRQFIENYYVSMKKENPKFPFLIRECTGVTPTVWARYAKGEERCNSLTELTADEVLNAVKNLNK